MSGGVGAFNKAASNAYEVLSYQEKEQLKEKAESIEKNTQLTSIDIRHRAAAVKKNQEPGAGFIYFCFIYKLPHSSENYKNTDIML